MSELLRCPFCGGEAETKMYRWGEKQDGEAIWCYYIFCTNCQSMSDNLFTDKDCAIAAWNTRTASPRFTEEEREAIRRLYEEYACGVLPNCCETCTQSPPECCTQYAEQETENAIATVRQMLTASEIAGKGKG